MNDIKNKVKRFKLNQQGRDFVIGDLHGKYNLLMKMLAAVGFDKEKDRLFSVGDLVDRGEDSLKCLELIYEPWFFACIGNHEDMLIEAYSGNENAFDNLISNGGSWTFQQDQQLLKIVAQDLLDRCSLVMVVETPFGRRNIVHAEMIRNINREDVSDKDIDEWNFDSINEVTMIWGRTIQESRMRSLLWKPPENLSPIYCGHTPVKHPEQIFKHRFIDTGAVFARYKGVNTERGLTMVNLMTEETYFQNEFEEFENRGKIWKS